MARVSFDINGQPASLDVEPTRRAIDVLREDLHLTGSKEGCGSGECGACTILLDGETRLACLLLAGQLHGRSVQTVEALPASETGACVRRAFEAAGAVQCGYCTPGMELAALRLLQRNPQPSREQIREALSGNLCRCTGYVKIIDAVEAAAAELAAQRPLADR